MMFPECCKCDQERYELNGVCDDCLRRIHKLELDRVKAKRKLNQKVWAVIDVRYGIVGLYATKRLATKACDEGIGLDSGYAGTVRSMVVRKSIEA
ncbi:MAG: hypothetical protein ACK53V_17155 [Planctomycetota bacterium]|jgi:hypothetical protein